MVGGGGNDLAGGRDDGMGCAEVRGRHSPPKAATWSSVCRLVAGGWDCSGTCHAGQAQHVPEMCPPGAEQHSRLLCKLTARPLTRFLTSGLNASQHQPEPCTAGGRWGAASGKQASRQSPPAALLHVHRLRFRALQQRTSGSPATAVSHLLQQCGAPQRSISSIPPARPPPWR